MNDKLSIQSEKGKVANNSFGLHPVSGLLVRTTDYEIINHDIFPNAKINEREIVAQSSYHSTSLFKSICNNENGHAAIVRGYLKNELRYQLSLFPIITGMKQDCMTEPQLDIVVELIIKEILPKATWLSKRQFPVIIQKGFMGQLSEYKKFSIANLADWIEAYRISIKPILFKQMQYQGAKLEQPKKELTEEEKIKHIQNILKNQLNIIKLILNNPYVFEEKQLGSQLKDHFKQGLQRYLASKKYNLNLAFDYLLDKGLINPNENEIDKIAKGKSVQVLEGLNPPEVVVNKWKLIYAKNEYMSGVILQLIETEKGKEFIDKI